MRASVTSAIPSSPRADAGATRVSQRASPPSATGRPRPSVTVTRTLLSGSTVGVVGLHDLLHKGMTNDVFLVEPDERDAVDVSDHLHGFDQPRRPPGREVDLRN